MTSFHLSRDYKVYRDGGYFLGTCIVIDPAQGRLLIRDWRTDAESYVPMADVTTQDDPCQGACRGNGRCPFDPVCNN